MRLADWSKGLGAGEDEEVWSQMRDYWVATGQISAERADAIGLDTEDAFREMGLWASWGHGSDWTPTPAPTAGDELTAWGAHAEGVVTNAVEEPPTPRTTGPPLAGRGHDHRLARRFRCPGDRVRRELRLPGGAVMAGRRKSYPGLLSAAQAVELLTVRKTRPQPWRITAVLDRLAVQRDRDLVQGGWMPTGLRCRLGPGSVGGRPSRGARATSWPCSGR